MGCNGWNHPPDCRCGWGGDTGGRGRYGSQGAASSIRRIRVPDGLEWSLDRKPSTQSYVNPNARCPVCGEAVFFYRSPYGGRVFFDDLGPPWPKHPCTDNPVQRSSSAPVLPPMYAVRRPIRSGKFPIDWQPFVPLKSEVSGSGVVFSVNTLITKTAGSKIVVPANFPVGAPTYWRRATDDSSRIDLLTIAILESGEVVQKIITVPSWFNSEEEALSYSEEDELPAGALCRVGWSLSFAYKKLDDLFWHTAAGVDFEEAKKFYDMAAHQGEWVALNNLGVMERDGLIRNARATTAFDYFRRAAATLELQPLYHLSNCYRYGIGTERNVEKADWVSFIHELISKSKKKD
jgi:hypothetical protein